MKQVISLFLFGILGALLAGCGGGASERTRVKGTVTYEGKSVAMGVVYINADTGRKNDGPQGYAEIIDGQYDTGAAKGKGATPGYTVIRIEAFDGKGDDERPKGKLLFAYEKRTELAKDEAAVNLDIKSNEVLKSGSAGAQTGP